MCRRSDSGAAVDPLGLIRVVHVGRTISGGPPMNEQNLEIALHHLRRISRASRRAQRVEAARRARHGTADEG